jgi:hypothetical protein
VEGLSELEQLSKLGLIELYYGDECRVSIEPCVPYGWQFKDEKVFMPASKGAGLNCFALLSRANELLFETTRRKITSEFIVPDTLVQNYAPLVQDFQLLHTSIA